ncbi:MAG: hypothetical protein FJ318_05525 [SAR202 cluster bacterium]|nr:hypothetical protein [SAR202 cluster bacterium]
MMPDFARGHVGWEFFFSGMIFVLSIVVALIVHPVLTSIAKRVTSNTKGTLDDRMVEALTVPLQVFALTQGVLLGLTNTTDLSQYQGTINAAWVISLVLNIAFAVNRVIGAFITW